MVALFSPPVFSTKGWLLEEEPLSYDVSSEYSFPYQFYSPQTQIEVEIESSTAPSPDDPAMVKKLSHNASERDRRKKINNLVSSLRSLLPVADQTKKELPAKFREGFGESLGKQESMNKESQRKISQHNSEFVVSTSR
ncbi:hypothetical protein GYH30_052942 [Glycine max]|nr:hypothetical protein GYH30_052942 [Glycine max]